jgi:hypothetical protein
MLEGFSVAPPLSSKAVENLSDLGAPELKLFCCFAGFGQLRTMSSSNKRHIYSTMLASS